MENSDAHVLPIGRGESSRIFPIADHAVYPYVHLYNPGLPPFNRPTIGHKCTPHLPDGLFPMLLPRTPNRLPTGADTLHIRSAVLLHCLETVRVQGPGKRIHS